MIIILFSDLYFNRSGFFQVSPYCVSLQAKEVLVNSQIHVENASICVNVNVGLLHPYVPLSMALTREGPKRNKYLVSSESIGTTTGNFCLNKN